MSKNGYVERLLESDYKGDKVLYAYVKARCKDLSIITSKNRGSMFESCLTQKPVLNEGGRSHNKVSNGDGYYNGERVEIKYLTTKTKADFEKNGTTCKKFLIGFNDKNSITLRLINTKDLILTEKNQLKYQDNCNLGVVVEVFHA